MIRFRHESQRDSIPPGCIVLTVAQAKTVAFLWQFAQSYERTELFFRKDLMTLQEDILPTWQTERPKIIAEIARIRNASGSPEPTMTPRRLFLSCALYDEWMKEAAENGTMMSRRFDGVLVYTDDDADVPWDIDT